ncbi:MAG: hypothetical protein ACMV1B_01445 [Prevotella sp.]
MSKWFTPLETDYIESVSISTKALRGDSNISLGNANKPSFILSDDAPVSFKIWIAGGIHGMDYQVSCHVITKEGRHKEIEFRIRVKD